jgi:outer membrane immunogenic protein
MTSKLIKTGLVLAALLAAPFAANAADLRAPTYKAPAYVAPLAPSWTGFYVGLNAGYGFGDANWSGVLDPSPTGFLVGGTIGYNLQTGSWVWGIEADLAWSNMDDTVTGGGGRRTTELPWFGTARGRIGYAGWGSMMPYFTAGAAFAGVDNTRNAVSVSDTMIGWTAGLGVEYMLWSNWSVKLEYLYADLGTADGPAATKIDVTANIVRAGINYRF